MIEAGQMEQRAGQPPSPSSSRPSSNAPDQNPAVEKSEPVFKHTSKLFNSLSCYNCFISLSFFIAWLPFLSSSPDSGGLVENSSDNRRSNLLQFPGGSWDGVPGLQKG